jgi:rhodanese-related sulfurtransferase
LPDLAVGRPRVGHTAVVGRHLATVLRALVLASVLVVVACGGSDSSGDDAGVPATDVALVGPDEFAAQMTDSDAVVVNVHVPYEGEIAGTDLFIPFDEILSSEDLPGDKDQPLLVYCRSGNMSAQSTAELIEAGYRDVTELEGGMQAWEAAGRTIELVPEHSDAAAAG